MPRHLVNRPRAFQIFHHGDYLAADSRPIHLTWEWFSAYLYVAGGVLLTIGSVLFLPPMEDYVADGSFLFVVASVFYLIVSLHDLAEIAKATTFCQPVKTTQEDLLEVGAGMAYALGAMAFIVGSILFLPSIDIGYPAAWCFIGGSVLFVVGACVNVWQTYDSPDKISLQYANLEAMTFVSGSCVYVCASIPYLYGFDSEQDAWEIFEMVALLYIWGSLLFLVGGVVNIFRLLAVHHNHLQTLEQALVPLNTTKDEIDNDQEAALQHQSMDTSIVVSESIMTGGMVQKVPSAEDLVFGADTDASEKLVFREPESTA